MKKTFLPILLVLAFVGVCYAQFGGPMPTTNTNPQVTTTPSPNNVPQAYNNGQIDAGWLPSTVMIFPSCSGILNYSGSDIFGNCYGSSNQIPANYIANLSESQITNLITDLASKAVLPGWTSPQTGVMTGTPPSTAPAPGNPDFWFDSSNYFNLGYGLNTNGPINTPGPVSIGSTYLTVSTLAQLTADANFAGTVYLAAPITLTANLTLTCGFRPLNGAIITLGAYNLAINGNFEAGLYPVFNANSTGSVSFGQTPKGGYLPEWWGATGNGTTDDTTACNLAKAAAESTHGTLVFSSGKTYAIQQFQIDQGAWQVSAWGAKILHNGSTNSPVSGTNDLIVAGPSNIYTAAMVRDFHWRGGLLIAKQSTSTPTNALLWVGDFAHSTFEFEGLQGGNSWMAPDPTTCYAKYGIYIQGITATGSTGVYYMVFKPGLENGFSTSANYVYDYNGQNYSNNISFYDPKAQLCGIGSGVNTATGFDFQGGQNIAVYSGDAENNLGLGINLESGSRDIHFYGAWVENNDGGLANQQIANNQTAYNSSFEGTVSNSPGSALFTYFSSFKAQTAAGTINYSRFTQLHITDQGACTMSSGACSAQQLGGIYGSSPNCFANWTGTGTLTGLIKLPTSGGNTGCTGSGAPYPCCTGSGAGTCYQVTPTSSIGTDSAQVNWFCLGN